MSSNCISLAVQTPALWRGTIVIGEACLTDLNLFSSTLEIKQSSFCIFNMITVSGLQTSITLSLQRPLAQHRLVFQKCNQLTRRNIFTQVLDTLFSSSLCRERSPAVPLALGSCPSSCKLGLALKRKAFSLKTTKGFLLTVLRHIHTLLGCHVIAFFFWGQVWNLNELIVL